MGGIDDSSVAVAEGPAARVVAYDPAWPQRFERERAQLERIAADAGEPLTVHHGGSTAVPGLAAKPVIDLFAEAATLAAAERLVPWIVDAGYRYVSEYEAMLPTRRFLYRGEHPARAVNLHMYARGDAEVARHLALRDWLRANDADRDAYAQLKRDLARSAQTMDAYTGGKTELIRSLELPALVQHWRGRPRIERSITVASSPEAVAPWLEPAGLAQWLGQRVRRDGDTLTVEVDEEYGYRRVLTAQIEDDEPARALVLRWTEVRREWDGQHSPGVVGAAGASWVMAEPGLTSRLTLTPVATDTDQSCCRIELVEEGHCADGPLLGYHEAWWRCHLELLAERAGARADSPLVIDVEPLAEGDGMRAAWRRIAGEDGPAHWCGEGGRMTARVGSVVALRWHDPGDEDGCRDVVWGFVQQVRPGRALRLSLRGSGGRWMHDVELEAQRRGGVRVRVDGVSARDAATAARQRANARAGWEAAFRHGVGRT
jgi:GrpB-like predicted nucleotidyltransferase (UPF0157 family)